MTKSLRKKKKIIRTNLFDFKLPALDKTLPWCGIFDSLRLVFENDLRIVIWHINLVQLSIYSYKNITVACW